MARKKPPEDEPGCCSCIGRVMCAMVLAPSFVGIIALSIAAMSGGRNTNWMKYQQMEPPYTLQSGYDGFMVFGQYGVSVSEKLREISMPFWVLGIVSVGLLGLSVLLALTFFLLTMSGFSGRYLVIFTIPMGMTQLAAVIGYVIVAVFRLRSYTLQSTGGSFAYTPVPDWGWICAFCVGVLWLWCSAWAGVIPRRRQHHDEEYAAAPPQQKLGFTTQPPASVPSATAAPSPAPARGWLGGGKEHPPMVAVTAPLTTPNGTMPADALPVPVPQLEEKKGGLAGFGFGRKKKKEEAAEEEFRARPFTETLQVDGGAAHLEAGTGATSAGAGPPATVLTQPAYEETTGAWNPPTGQQPSWVGAPEPDEVTHKSRGLTGLFRK